MGKNEADGAKTAPSCSANQHGKRRKAVKYQNIPGSRLPRFSCQIIHVGAKNIQIYGQTNPDTNIMNLLQTLFSEFLKLEKESRSERHQQNMNIHYPNISVKPVKQCHDNKT
jgi:predicted metal-dependent hydrolase